MPAGQRQTCPAIHARPNDGRADLRQVCTGEKVWAYRTGQEEIATRHREQAEAVS